ncbi:MAG: radical SAM protein [Planctomycetes bacterium]|nr:radical SAM protein [Planctomycetota bacterium]
MFDHYGLVLTITHNCNMRCTYCYAGGKVARTMPEPIALKAIDRAIASVSPGGTLDLGFFGGEPLLEAELTERLIEYARSRTTAAGLKLALSMTTNGTVTHPRAWSVMTRPDLNLAISCDGMPAVQDRHRRFAGGRGSSQTVLATIRRLLGAGKKFRVAMVVRPDSVDLLPENIEFLQRAGVTRIEPTLDVWAEWNDRDVRQLERAIARCAEIWRAGLPRLAIGWFDEKLLQLARLPGRRATRCGFGRGELAVAPSGRMYPCERLVGDDAPGNPMALPGSVMDGDDFLHVAEPPGRNERACHGCAMLAMCNTFCRCANYVRTGDVGRPDGLLCAWNQACLNETARIMQETMLFRPCTRSSEETEHEYART